MGASPYKTLLGTAPGNFTGIWLQKDKLKVIQPKQKENSWLKNDTAKTLVSPNYQT